MPTKRRSRAASTTEIVAAVTVAAARRSSTSGCKDNDVGLSRWSGADGAEGRTDEVKEITCTAFVFAYLHTEAMVPQAQLAQLQVS